MKIFQIISTHLVNFADNEFNYRLIPGRCQFGKGTWKLLTKPFLGKKTRQKSSLGSIRV
jgi:hypothetical protein